MIDQEDREIIAQGLPLVVVAIATIVVGLITIAAGAGIAWRVFELLGGL